MYGVRPMASRSFRFLVSWQSWGFGVMSAPKWRTHVRERPMCLSSKPHNKWVGLLFENGRCLRSMAGSPLGAPCTGRVPPAPGPQAPGGDTCVRIALYILRLRGMVCSRNGSRQQNWTPSRMKSELR
jgi:hypothetical protein